LEIVNEENHKTPEEMRKAERGMILTLQLSLILESVTEESRKNLYCWKSLPKTSARHMVLTICYSKFIAVNFLLKLYFEKSH
jgi:hypothetical protein